MMRTNKDVLSVAEKQERLIYTKILRAWAKQNKTNQFDIALKLLSTFYRTFSLQLSFIKDKGLTNEFENYFLALEGRYTEMFEIIENFVGSVENKIIPLFGV